MATAMDGPRDGEGTKVRRRTAAAALASLLCGTSAFAQTPPQTPSSASTSAAARTPAARTGRPAAPAAAPNSGGGGSGGAGAAEADDGEAEVEVTAGPRIQSGAVVGDVKPELQLSPADIQSYGVSTLTELLAELSPQTRSDRGRGGEGPVVLLNGRRISSFAEIRDIPTEAIQRVDILPEEVALKYGYTANQRVVNVVLRRFFRALTAEGSVGAPTEGGQLSGSGEVDLLRIRREARLNLDVKYQASGDLLESDRNLRSVAAGLPYDVLGNVTPLSGVPTLAALGPAVPVAGVPASAAGRAPTLADLLATGGAANAGDVGRYRTLLPATQSISANVVWAKPLPWRLAGTVNATIGATTSDSLQGLPGITLGLPATSAFNPLGQPVLIDRYLTGAGPLTQSTDGWTAHLGGTLNRDQGRWRFSLTGAYDHADVFTVTDSGFDPSPLNALLAAGATAPNPYGALPLSQLLALPETKARSLTDTLNGQFLANGPLLQVPAGQLFASFKAGDTETMLDSRSQRLGLVQGTDLSRNDFNAQANFDLPVISNRYHVLGFLGEASLNGNVAIDEVSDFGALLTYGYGVNWKPWDGLALIFSDTHDESAPTVSQLGGPVITTPGSRVLDFVTGQVVDVLRTDGGARGLQADQRQVMKWEVNYKPIPTQDLTFSANFIKSRIDNPIATFPAVTAEIQAAFPDRFTRNAQGELTAVDFRPVNFARQDREELRYGVNYTRPVGPQPPPRQRGFGGGGPGGAGGYRQRFGGNGAPPPPERNADGSAAAPPPPADGQGASSGGGERQASARGDRSGGGAGGFGGGGGAGGGFRGGGGGGRGGGFGGGPGGGGGRLQFAVYHTVFFDDTILVRRGGPVFDLLNGSASGSGGGQPRHEVEGQAGLTLFGLGARVSLDYKSGTSVRGGSASSTGDLNFSGLTTTNFRLFANLGQLPGQGRNLWLRGARLTLNVSNLFDQRITVRDASGATPLIYQGAYIDPAGRTVRLGLRKLFY